ncbi:MAG: hypothetical protein JNM84_25510 [Planctomycetes bacterium]|nr:hypothetical protein [Planctomycetota bacterium]
MLSHRSKLSAFSRLASASRLQLFAQAALLAVCATTADGWGQIYDNGTVITAPGAGFAGADVSQLENVAPLNLTVFGFNADQAANRSVADDFTVCGTWAITDLEFFVYETNGTSPTIDGVYVRIWNGDPSTTGTPHWPGGGFFSANLYTNLSTNTFHAYRTVYTPTTAVNREIYAVKVATPAIPMPGGVYWIEVQFTGDGMLAGPWVPPISTLGCGKTGFAKQCDTSTSTYTTMATGSGYGVGVPFRIYGTAILPNIASAATYGVGSLGTNGIGAWVLGDAAVPVRTPVLGSCYPLRLEHGYAGMIPFVVLGTQSCQLPVTPCVDLLVCPPWFEFTMPAFDASFESQLCIPIPQGNEFCGACFYLQAFWLDPATPCGLAHSEGLQLCLGN